VTKTKKIFVGGLSAQTTVEDVKKYFSAYGKVSTRLLVFGPQPLAQDSPHFTHSMLGYKMAALKCYLQHLKK